MSLYETGVREALDEYIIKKSKEKRDYKEYWSASSAGYCMRKNIFDRLGVPAVTDDARKYRVFEAGHIFHEFMQRITKEAGLSIAQEVELIDDKLMVKGHFDDLILIKEDTPFGVENIGLTSHQHGEDMPEPKQHLILYDYKTVSSQSFKYKKDKMSHYHEMQLGTYMYMWRNPDVWLPKNDWLLMKKHLKEARILNISKDDLRMSEVQLMWSPQLEKKVYSYWSTLNGYWKNKQMPKCTCADYEINKKTGLGFMADERYNPYYYEGEPCSLAWLKKTEKEWKK
jgi:hypothetical protein